MTFLSLKTGLRVTAVALALGLGGSASAAELLKVKMAIGGINWVPYAAITLGKQMGLFEKHGIDLDLWNTNDGAQTITAVVTGSADLGCGYFDNTTQLTAKGRATQGIVMGTRLPGLAMFVTPKFEGKIKTAKDLEGLQVGSSSLGGLTSSRLMLARYLSVNNISADKVPVVLVGGPDTTLAAIQSSDVAAIVTGEPSITLVEQRAGKPTTKLFDTRTLKGTMDFYGAEYPSNTIYGTNEWVEKHPREAQGVTTAIVEALRYINSHTPEEIVDKMPVEVTGTNKALYLAVFKGMTQIFSPDGRFPEPAVKVAFDTISGVMPEVAETKVDMHKLYTNRFTDEANKILDQKK